MNEISKPTVVYLSWGEGCHIDEIAFSILSAARWGARAFDAVRFAVYTDNPGAFKNLGVETVEVTSNEFTEWRGSKNFNFRIKIMALKYALQRFNSPVILLDGDTYFLKKPEKLFARIAPGRTLLHVWECYLIDSDDTDYSEIPKILRKKPLTNTNGQAWNITDRFSSWNAGVVGLDPKDLSLVDEVLHLSDQIYESTHVRTSEQLAFSFALHEKTDVGSAIDVVYHYYTWRLRSEFAKVVTDLIRESASMPLVERAMWLYGRRPRCRFRRRVRVNIEQIARRLGFLRSSVLFNSEGR